MRQASLIRIGKQDLDPAQEAVEDGLLPVRSYLYEVGQQTAQEQQFSVQTPGGKYEHLAISLLGEHQIENATLALAALEELRKRGLGWDEAALRQGLQATHWPARLQIVRTEPIIIIDGAHNGDSMYQLRQSLQTLFPQKKVWMVFSAIGSKDLDRIICELAGCQAIILAKIQNARAASVEVLAEVIERVLPEMPVYRLETTQEAMEKALELAGGEDLICVSGSLYFAAEALRWAAEQGAQGAAADIASVDH
jgi:dihydrofolate synthase/folylpolyglutamate synthase